MQEDQYKPEQRNGVHSISNIFEQEQRQQLQQQHCNGNIVSEENVVFEAQLMPMQYEPDQTNADDSNARNMVKEEDERSCEEKAKQGNGAGTELVDWTDDMIRFLIESYDAVDQQLWEKNKERAKFKKKWDPIAQLMQEKFGREFTKQQCLSKYWKVRRECLDFKLVADKISRCEPPWDEVVDKEALKPRYYAIWSEYADKHSDKNWDEIPGCEGRVSLNELKSKKFKARKRRQERLKLKRGRKRRLLKMEKPKSEFSDFEDDEFQKEDVSSLPKDETVRENIFNEAYKPQEVHGGDTLREMQFMLSSHIMASAKREEALNMRHELILGLLRQNIAHMTSREALIEERQKAQSLLVSRLNANFEKLMERLATLEEGLASFVRKCPG